MLRKRDASIRLLIAISSFLRRKVTAPGKPRKTPVSRKLGETGRQTKWKARPGDDCGPSRKTLRRKSRDSPNESRQDEFAAEAEASLHEQLRVEASDTLSFDDYLSRYFAA